LPRCSCSRFELIAWDDPLPKSILKKWKDFSQDLSQLEQIQIPRWIGSSPDCKREIHGFFDASARVYDAVVYMRTYVDGVYSSRIIAPKSRVAPLKTTTIPRLELQGAVLLAELAHHVQQQFDIPPTDVYLWTNTSICLHWINCHPRKCKIYIANRVSKIQALTQPSQWNHVISELNPADCGSRGLSPSDLKSAKLWWHGPAWLLTDYEKKPSKSTIEDQDVIQREELKPVLALLPQNQRAVLTHIPYCEEQYILD